MEMVICQEAPSHGKNIYGNLTAARDAPSKKVRYTRYYRFLRCAFLSVKQNYGKIRPRRAAVVYLPMSNLFSISKILSTTILYIYILLFWCDHWIVSSYSGTLGLVSLWSGTMYWPCYSLAHTKHIKCGTNKKSRDVSMEWYQGMFSH